MPKPTTMETLIELATDEVDKAAVRLGHSIRFANDAEQKLAILNQYRDDYGVRLQKNCESGLTAMDYRNFQQFIDKLDQAISGQQQIVRNAKKQIEEDKSSWQASERKRVSFDTLATRAQKVVQKKENKLDQKQMDEFASRRSRYR
jgi:flagellar FliJ protein